MKWLTLSLIKAHSRIEYDCEDSLLELYANAAEETVLNIVNRSYEELKAVPEYQTWLNGDNEANIPPEGESGQQMKERVLQAFSCIREDTCLITHGGVIAAIMEHLFPEEKKDRYQWQPKPGCGYVLSENGSFDTL